MRYVRIDCPAPAAWLLSSLLLFTLWLTVCPFAQASEPPSKCIEIASDTRMPDVMPDERVQITGKNFPAQRGNIEVIFDKDTVTPEEVQGELLTFRVPGDTAPGRYSVVVKTTAEPKDEAPVPGELRVKPKGPPKITTVSPLTGYPTADDRFNFTIVGENFGQKAEDNEVIINGIPLSKNARDDGQCDAAGEPKQKLEKPCLAVVDSHQLRLFGVKAERYQGPIKIQVGVYEAVSQPPSPATLSRISEDAALPLAVFLSLLLMAILLWVVWKGLGTYKIGGESYRPSAMFFLDKDTNTYSLSKLQLFAWTAAAVFGYIYLMIANLLIQWKFAMPDLPEGLPLLLGISAGTTVTAIGLNDHVGGKGSGPVSPSWADFITSGGIVAPERLQFFIWTIIGIGGFVSLLLFADPSTLQQLPNLPENFLTIMGISSAAYLGGKTVRKPGPVIKTLAAVAVNDANQLTNPKPSSPATPQTPPKPPKGPVLVLNLKGEDLDANATVKIDDKVLRSDQFWLTPKKAPEPPSARTTELDVNLDAGLIEEVGQPLLEGEHTLTLINDDGKSSSARFPVDPMSIEQITKKATAGTGSLVFVVTGRNFGDGTRGEWVFQKPDAQPNPIEATDIMRVSASELNVTLAVGNDTGPAKLTLISPMGLKASGTFQIDG